MTARQACLVLGFIMNILQIGSYNFTQNVLIAQCMSFCLEEFGASIKFFEEYDVYMPRYRCEEEEDATCAQCFNGCAMDFKDGEGITCSSGCNTASCDKGCLFLRGLTSHRFSEKETSHRQTKAEHEVNIRDVRTQCQMIQRSNSVTSYIRWAVDSPQHKNLPLAFVVELKTKDKKDWMSFVTTYGWLPIKHMNTSSLYQFRVTPVLKHGIGGSSITSDWFNTVSDAVCGYHIALLPHSTASEPEMRNVKLLPEFVQVFGPLEYHTNYTVKVASCLNNHPCSERTSDVIFTSLSCLDTANNSYKLCPPESPEITDHVMKLRNSEDSCVCDVTIHWNPVKHLSANNPIENYSIVWEKQMVAGWTVPKRQWTHVLPNNTEHTLRDLESNSSYNIFLAVYSEGGWSQTVGLSLNTSGICPQGRNTTLRKSGKKKFGDRILFLICIPLAVATVLLVLATAFRGRLQRKLISRSFYLKRKKNHLDKMTRNPLYDQLERSENHFSLTTFHETDSDNSEPTFLDDYEISINWLSLGGTLGSGAFGHVVKASLSKAPNALKGNLFLPMTVAVKMTKDFATEEDRVNLRKEIELMKVLGRHKNIVSIIGHCNQNNLCLVMDFCCHGDLKTYLRNMRSQPSTRSSSASAEERCSSDSAVGKSLHSGLTTISLSDTTLSADGDTEGVYPGISFELLLSFARQVTIGMEYLVHRKFVHRDLAARNILVCEGYIIKISDFGLTRDVYENSAYAKTSGGKLPLKWMAPEAIFDQIYTHRSDVWSYGIVLWEIITLGGSPYPGINTSDIYRMLKRGYRMEKPDHCDQRLYNIMRCCWRTNPLKRPTFSQLKSAIEELLLSCSESGNSYVDFGESKVKNELDDVSKYYQNSATEMDNCKESINTNLDVDFDSR